MALTRSSQYYDNTKISCYKECPRKYFLRHVMHWTVDYSRKAPALVFGGAWHEGMDAIWASQGEPNGDKVERAVSAFRTHWEENEYTFKLSLEEAEELGARTPGVAHEMFFSYCGTRERLLEEATVHSIEQPIAMPFPELEDTWYVGKLDKVFSWSGYQHIMEHKTTTAYAVKGQFQPDWVESWSSASQVKGYQLVGSVYYPKLQDVWIDGALVHKKIHDAFKLVPVGHSWPLLQDWIGDTKQWIVRIQTDLQKYADEGLRSGAFPRNEDQCFGKYSRCPFLSICSTIADPTLLDKEPIGFRVEKWEPFSELGLEKLVKGAK